MPTIDDFIRDFRIAAMEKGSEGGSFDATLYDRLRASFRQLSSLGAPGRVAFRSLLSDPSPSVRAWVAAQLLAEGDINALPVLRAMATESGMGGFNARMTIQEYEAGRLKPPFGDAAA
jgi:hypothetical protein